MSSSATKKKTAVEVFPSIMGKRGLAVSHDPTLEMLNSIEITAQVHSGNHDLIFGSVKSDIPVTAYAVENGELSNGSVRFQLSIEGIVYHFTGHFVGTDIAGTVNNPNADATNGSHTEEGSWSAQAQPGPGEGEEKKNQGKHKKRSAR